MRGWVPTPRRHGGIPPDVEAERGLSQLEIPGCRIPIQPPCPVSVAICRISRPKVRSRMVNAVVKPHAPGIPSPTTGLSPEPTRALDARDHKTCPRCNGHLRMSYHEPECLQCGYADYRYTPPTSPVTSLVSSATRYVLRYVGESSALADTLTHAELRPVRGRAAFQLTCPFCSGPMLQSPLSGKRTESTEDRYKCGEDHRVSLTSGSDGPLDWK